MAVAVGSHVPLFVKSSLKNYIVVIHAVDVTQPALNRILSKQSSKDTSLGMCACVINITGSGSVALTIALVLPANTSD